MSTDPTAVEYVDVLVVGAGISGIGAGRYLRVEHPSKSFAILEAREASGGTWDLFRYPGIRSDSDLHTFGYKFEPWREKQAIASASQILTYLRETATSNGLDPHIRYQHRLVAADWSAEQASWLVRVERGDTGETVHLRAGWLFCASGYYRYDEGFTPHFSGRERFAGEIVHPQHWPEDLDHTGKRVVVIGSGATAVTLIPAMADQAEHVTMLQRTPSYIMPLAREDALANLVSRVLGDVRGYAVNRRINILLDRAIWQFCGRFPRAARRIIRRMNAKLLPEGFPVDEHFNPPYNPWEQRLCVVPDGDLFTAISSGKASVVTNRIETFTETGVLLTSGEEIPADIIVTATGLKMELLADIELTIDGNPVDLSKSVVYRGMMLSGIPNLSIAFGYTKSSWTLKIDMLCEYFCRLLSYMDVHGYDTAWAVADPNMSTRPMLDFGAGYVQRALDKLPKQGPAAPWLMSSNDLGDRKLLTGSELVDDNLHFAGADSRRSATTATPARAARVAS